MSEKGFIPSFPTFRAPTLRASLEFCEKIGVFNVQDIKLENLLLDPFSCVKIADFGVAAAGDPKGLRRYRLRQVSFPRFACCFDV